MEAWAIYVIRRILAGDICNAWNAFGCLAAQLSPIRVALHLGVTENAEFAISYDHEVRARIHRLARKRDPSADYAKFLSGENGEGKRYLKTDLARGRPSSSATPIRP